MAALQVNFERGFLKFEEYNQIKFPIIGLETVILTHDLSTIHAFYINEINSNEKLRASSCSFWEGASLHKKKIEHRINEKSP